MANSLTLETLSDDISTWQGLPLSINGNELMPLDYNAGLTGWIIYGKYLNKSLLCEFQQKLKISMVIVSSWQIKNYLIVRIAGTLPKKAIQIAEMLKLDVALINDLPTLQSPGLLVMDMDSTAISIECIDEIAKKQGVGDLVSTITENAMQGNLDFSTSLKKRVATLKNTNISILDEIKQTLPIMPGLSFIIKELHKRNWKIVIISGGFTYFTEFLKDKFKLHADYANELSITQSGKLTGKIVGEIVDAKFKAKTLQSLASDLNIPINQTVAIGDGANDLLMIKAAGYGIAYHGKPIVAQKAKNNIKFADLIGLYCILSASLDSEA